MQPNRSRRLTWRTIRLLGLWLATGAVALSAEAQEEEARSEAGVHGTITIDFEKVTVAELLKLVETLEKVEGDIHLVSSDRRDGRPAIVVGGGRGTLSLADPGQPHRPRLSIARFDAKAPAPESPERSATPGDRSRPRAPLAALGRWLGLTGVTPAGEIASATPRAADRPPLHRSATPRGMTTGPESSGPPEGSMRELSAGSYIGSMANGELSRLQGFRSPWPGANAEARTESTKTDAMVTQAIYTRPDDPPRHESSRGDTFDGLARRFYGDAHYAWALWWANRDRVAWPDALTPGKSLRVPAIGELDPKMVMAKSGPNPSPLPQLEPAAPPVDHEVSRASLVKPSPTAGASEQPGGFAIHVVRPEDTLRIIAREKCGDERKALEIIALNRDILSHEGRPRVGQRLILPTSKLAATP